MIGERTINGKYTSAVVYVDDVEQTCLDQIAQMVNNEQFTNPIAIMPDCHAGYGSVIGFTMKLGDKLAPNIVGVDIGCGMLAVNLGQDRSVVDLIGTDELDHSIRREIPMGKYVRNDKRRWLMDAAMDRDVSVICERIGVKEHRVFLSVGTLGGGNHFIEFAKSTRNGDVWLIVHTGSRNFGKRICDYWQHEAKRGNTITRNFVEDVERIKCSTTDPHEIGRKIAELKGNRPVMEKGLEHLEGLELQGYLCDMGVAQKFAQENRKAIVGLILRNFPAVALGFAETIESVHNYINFDDHIIRKGAIQCNKGQLAIIPLNMRDGTFIVEGKGNLDWNYSAPHGAGRVLSRTAAKAKLSMEDFTESMDGIYSQSVVESTLDEAPMAYKDASLIESTIGPAAEIIDRLVPLHNLKAC